MRFILPKTVSENKKLFKVFSALFGFLLLVISLILVLPYLLNLFTPFGYQDEISKDFNKELLANRKGPLYGVNGYVTQVENNGGESAITIQSDVGQTYYVTLNSETKINSLERKVGKTQVETTLTPVPHQEVKTESRVYLLTNIDLLYENKIQTDQIKFIEIYED